MNQIARWLGWESRYLTYTAPLLRTCILNSCFHFRLRCKVMQSHFCKHDNISQPAGCCIFLLLHGSKSL
jgi:hypothetical protein